MCIYTWLARVDVIRVLGMIIGLATVVSSWRVRCRGGVGLPNSGLSSWVC